MIHTSQRADLLDPSIQALFRDFPVALAVISDAGTPAFTNRAFELAYDPDRLAPSAWQALARDSLERWHLASVPSRSGEAVPARIQSLRSSGWYLVAFEDTAAGEAGSLVRELVGLRDRVHELELESATDHLTGLWNRAHLDRTIESEIERTRLYQQPVTLVLVDIDDFKLVNDRQGHAAGDAVLREIADRIRAAVRGGDFAYRWGGDEFLVLASGAGYRAGARLAEQLRLAIAGAEFPGVGRLTASLGVAELDGDEAAAAWFTRLDQMLYNAKGAGRNRVIVDRRGNSDRLAGAAGGAPLRLVWREAFESGHPLVDSQHLRMFELANRLIDTMIGQDGSFERRDQVLDELLEHIRVHFADEEALLGRLGYDRLVEHRQVHTQLLERALKLRDLTVLGHVRPGTLVEFLAKDVVVQHLLAMDSLYFPRLADAQPGAGARPRAAMPAAP